MGNLIVFLLQWLYVSRLCQMRQKTSLLWQWKRSKLTCFLHYLWGMKDERFSNFPGNPRKDISGASVITYTVFHTVPLTIHCHRISMDESLPLKQSCLFGNTGQRTSFLTFVNCLMQWCNLYLGGESEDYTLKMQFQKLCLCDKKLNQDTFLVTNSFLRQKRFEYYWN